MEKMRYTEEQMREAYKAYCDEWLYEHDHDTPVDVDYETFRAEEIADDFTLCDCYLLW
jgi:hypothetical protein